MKDQIAKTILRLQASDNKQSSTNFIYEVVTGKCFSAKSQFKQGGGYTYSFQDNPLMFLQWLRSNLFSSKFENLKAGKFELLFQNIQDRSDLIYLIRSNLSPNDLNELKLLEEVTMAKFKP